MSGPAREPGIDGRSGSWEDHRDPSGYGTYGWGVEELEPRWTPDVPLADRITRVGRFRRIDPAQEGSLWPAPKWWALAGYAGIVGWALLRAWRMTGGLAGTTERADRRDLT